MKSKLLLYCTKRKLFLRKSIKDKDYYLDNGSEFNIIPKQDYVLNGKIVAECDFEVEEIRFSFNEGEKLKNNNGWRNYRYEIESLSYWDFYKKSCLSFGNLDDYFDTPNENKKVGYAIHIKNLHIFDEPKELSDFTTRKPQTYDSIVCDSCTDFGFDCKKCSSFYDYQQVMKAPQNMMKVCEWDIEDKILISIKPQWLCKILNHEKTIEVRKKVLREMIK